jgi:2-keto-4-pentenoate hydratase/2-oxohepta-3-ene-1,7-dioic acid hydratase in catechol pathway
MTTTLARTTDRWWIVEGARAIPLDSDAATTRGLLEQRDRLQAARRDDEAVDVSTLALESPITAPCRVVAQMVNYRSHAQDSGFDPARVLPTFFRKSSASVCGPTSDIVRPAHVRLLDYEVELGIVLGRSLEIGEMVTERSLPGLVAGLVVANDVSARDVQLSKGQFYESKSYPTFTPLGPYLVLVDTDDFTHLANLRLRLSVNGVERQDRTVADMIVRPAEALTLLARFQPMSAGDVLLTGTPGGTALKAPPKIVEKAAALLPPHRKWEIFFKKQAQVPAYLNAGDVVEASIASVDGRIDLGAQRNVVVSGS